MKKILFVATCDVRKRTGGGLANLAYYNAFRSVLGDKLDLAMPKEYCTGTYANAICVPQRSGFLRKEISFFLKGEQHRYKSFFKDFLLDHHNYSCVIINGGVYAGDVISLFHKYGIKVVVIHHNYEVEYCMDNKTFNTFWGLTDILVVKNEKQAYLTSDINCFLTNSDRQLFLQNYGESNSIPFLLGTFEPKEDLLDSCSKSLPLVANKLVVTGSMNTHQTINGILDFQHNYFPILDKKFPDWNVLIAGRNPSKSILDFADQSFHKVQVIANPEVIDDVILQGSIFLCPTCIGGGLKLRIMDGLRNGLPVLTHKVSSRGYDSFFDEPFFQIYNGKESFEEGLNHLIRFISETRERSSLIKRKYYETFGFKAGCKRVEYLVSQLLKI